VVVVLVPGPQGLMEAYGPTGVAAGLAVVPVAAQVDLQSKGTVGGGSVLAALIWGSKGQFSSLAQVVLG